MLSREEALDSKPADVADVVRDHFDEMAAEYDRITRKSHYFHEALIRSLREVVPAGQRVLEVGTATGDMLAALDPGEGVGIDLSPAMIDRAQSKYPNLRFHAADILDRPLREQFDFVVSVNVMEHVRDINSATAAMADMLAPSGTLLNITPHPLWALPFYIAERFELKVPEGWHAWRSRTDLIRAGELLNLRLVSFDRDFIVPRHLPPLSALNTAGWARPLRSRFGVIQRVVFNKPT